ncbi:MAG TPA: hypothetical protein VN455_14770, partial [Methanotrichaceae archaeon]|nr:hypothetical protein [Methanotrichaceae archaeon]
ITQGNMSANLSALNNTVINTSTNVQFDLANNTATNAPPENIVIQSEPSNKTTFQIGNGLHGNGSAFKTDMAAKPIKNASKMWYLIQGVPHGYT